MLFRQGVPPHASYLFKHALVQDAAYGTLLREPRRALHARIAEALERSFPDTVENQPEILARHCTEAGLIEKAAGLWGIAGQRSLSRSALVEAAEQLERALAQIATLPGTPALRRQQIKLQVASANALMHAKGHAAPETKASLDQARSLIEHAKALGEPPEDPLMLFSVLYGFWVASFVAFNGDMMRALAPQFLSLAENLGAKVPLMIGHRLMGTSLVVTGDFAGGRAHCDQAIGLYDPIEHRALVTRFGQDLKVAILCYRSQALWSLGHPEAALADADEAVKNARESNHAATLMYALAATSYVYTCAGKYELVNADADELSALANQKNALFWKPGGALFRGAVSSLTNKVATAVEMLISGMTAYRSLGSTAYLPWFLALLAKAYSELGQFDDAWRCIYETIAMMEKTDERWCEAEVHRLAGEIALLSPKPDTAKAAAYFERALAVPRQQQAKSWELRAAMSLAQPLA